MFIDEFINDLKNVCNDFNKMNNNYNKVFENDFFIKFSINIWIVLIIW